MAPCNTSIINNTNYWCSGRVCKGIPWSIITLTTCRYRGNIISQDAPYCSFLPSSWLVFLFILLNYGNSRGVWLVHALRFVSSTFRTGVMTTQSPESPEIAMRFTLLQCVKRLWPQHRYECPLLIEWRNRTIRTKIGGSTRTDDLMFGRKIVFNYWRRENKN